MDLSYTGTQRLNASLGAAGRSTLMNPKFQSNPRAPLGNKTLAQQNLRGFRLRNLQKDNDMQLQVSSPQRIQLPIYFNTPRRKDDMIAKSKLQSKNRDLQNSFFNNKAALNMSYNQSTHRIASQRRLKDYAMLAFACKRAGKSRDQGRSYYSTGVLCDNLGKYKKAIESYQKFLQVCKAIGDVHGEALAYNCIGVDFQKLAETDPSFYTDAIDFHLKHKEIADVAGKFLAHVNLGIIYEKLGDFEKASVNHQFALRYAIQMSSVAGQSIAIGNLGRVGSISNVGAMDAEKMQMFVERYLELSGELKYRKGESGAYMQLGKLVAQKGDFNNGVKHFYRAMKIADQTNDPVQKQSATVNFGVAQGNLKWEKKQKQIMRNLRQIEEKKEFDQTQNARKGLRILDDDKADYNSEQNLERQAVIDNKNEIKQFQEENQQQVMDQ